MDFNKTEYATAEHAKAKAEWLKAREEWQAAKTPAKRKRAAEQVEFWSNKMAFLSHAK